MELSTTLFTLITCSMVRYEGRHANVAVHGLQAPWFCVEAAIQLPEQAQPVLQCVRSGCITLVLIRESLQELATP